MLGDKTARNELLNALLERTDLNKKLFLGLAHGDSPENLDYLDKLIDNSDVKCETKVQSWVGSVIGTYAGPGAVAFVFYQE